MHTSNVNGTSPQSTTFAQSPNEFLPDVPKRVSKHVYLETFFNSTALRLANCHDRAVTPTQRIALVSPIVTKPLAECTAGTRRMHALPIFDKRELSPVCCRKAWRPQKAQTFDITSINIMYFAAAFGLSLRNLQVLTSGGGMIENLQLYSPV